MRTNKSRIELFLLLSVLIEYGILFAIIFTPKCVRADSFYPTMDVGQSKFYYTIGLAVKPPENQSENFDLYESNAGRLNGISFQEAERLSFSDFVPFTDFLFHRSVFLASTVSVLPGSNVGVYLYENNQTGHLIGIKNSWLFLGKYGSSGVEDILDFPETTYRDLAYYDGEQLYSRSGISYRTGPLGNFVPESSGSRQIGAFEVRNPIEVMSTNSTCREGTENTIVSAVIANKSVQTEVVRIGNSSVEIAPNTVRSISGDVYINSPGGTASLGVTSSLERCFDEKHLHSSLIGPGAGVLLLGRDDSIGTYSSWGATILDIPTFGTGGMYCVKRVPFDIPISVKSCVRRSTYKIDIPNAFNVYPGSNFQVPITFRNEGGSDSSSVSAVIEVSSKIDDYFVGISGIKSEYVTKKDNAYLVNFSDQRGEDVKLLMNFSLPTVIPAVDLSEEEVKVSIQAESKSLKLSIASESSFDVLNTTAICNGSRSGVKFEVEVVGNKEITTLRIPMRYKGLGDKTSKEYIVTTKFESKDVVLKNDEESVIELNGLFPPGVYQVFLIEKELVTSNNSAVLAVEEDTARPCSAAQIASETTRKKLSVVKVRPERKVLGVSNTGQVKIVPTTVNSKGEESKSINREINNGSIYPWAIILLIISSILYLFSSPKNKVER